MAGSSGSNKRLMLLPVLALLFQWEQAAAQPPNTCPNAATMGCWSTSAIQFAPDIAPVHALLLRTGKVAIISFPQVLKYQIADPATGSVMPEKPVQTFDDLYCSGHVTLFDGRVAAFGGGQNPGGPSIYSVATDTWTRGTLGDVANRFYPTCTMLATGRVLVIADDQDPPPASCDIYTPHIFDPQGAGQWTTLTPAMYW